MEKQNRSCIKAISHIRRSIDDASALQYSALTKMKSELVKPGTSPIKNKGKSLHYRVVREAVLARTGLGILWPAKETDSSMK
jgi:hypothetical protein